MSEYVIIRRPWYHTHAKLVTLYRRFEDRAAAEHYHMWLQTLVGLPGTRDDFEAGEVVTLEEARARGAHIDLPPR